MNILKLALLVALTASTVQLIPRVAIAAEDGGYLTLRGGYGWADDVACNGNDRYTLLQYENIGDFGLAYPS